MKLPLLTIEMLAAVLLATAAVAQQPATGGGNTPSTNDTTGTIAPGSPTTAPTKDAGPGQQVQSNSDCRSSSAKMTNGSSETCK